MTKAEYSKYESAVAGFMKREGIENLSSDSDSEYSFSWRGCECCGSELGGDRIPATGYNRTTKEVQRYTRICPDCIYYAEYGRLDDMTMIEVEADASADACE
jgi:hypothetical protein